MYYNLPPFIIQEWGRATQLSSCPVNNDGRGTLGQSARERLIYKLENAFLPLISHLQQMQTSAIVALTHGDPTQGMSTNQTYTKRKTSWLSDTLDH